MSILKVVSSAIESLRRKAKTLADLDAASSPKERGEALKGLLADDPSFWLGLAETLAAKPAARSAKRAAKIVEKPAPPATPKLPAATPAPKVAPPPATVSARTLAPKFPNDKFREQLGKAAVACGLNGPLERFRFVLTEDGRGKEYWDSCREVTAEVLGSRLLKEETDWRILVKKMKGNLFFTDKKGTEAFIVSCPKPLLSDLLLGEGGLHLMVEKVRSEEEANASSPYRINFIIDACVAVGKEAAGLLTNCKHATNRMKQKGFIQSDHWLVVKVAAMSAAKRVAADGGHKSIPASKYAKPEEVAAAAAADLKLDNIQQRAEGVAEEQTAPLAEIVVPPAPTEQEVVAPEGIPPAPMVDFGPSPAEPSPAASPVDPTTGMTDEELEAATAPPPKPVEVSASASSRSRRIRKPKRLLAAAD